jgi:hypothetical protein
MRLRVFGPEGEECRVGDEDQAGHGAKEEELKTDAGNG